jgi:hypothetical protein
VKKAPAATSVLFPRAEDVAASGVKIEPYLGAFKGDDE